jgi:long-subunit acyl-CoA synthetase (AMP-forming)
MAGPAVLTVADTIANSFLLAVQTRGDRPAIREKKFGIWQPTSWREWLQISKEIAHALHAVGFRPGDVASIMANAVPEWVFADMGILCAGGVSSGIYPTDSAAQVEYLINDSRTRVIFAEDEEQLDKILSCRSRAPTLQRVVVFDMEGLSGFSDPMVMSLAEFMALGRNHMPGRATLWQEMIASRGPDDLAILVYSSGTTGPPKGAMHANRSVTHQMRHADCSLQGETPSLSLRLANQLAYWLVFRNIRRMLGLDRCRLALTGAAPIAPDLIRWYLALGIEMREVYGQTENCGVATLMPADRIKLGSVGKAVPWGEVALSAEGEILIKGDFLSWAT